MLREEGNLVVSKRAFVSELAVCWLPLGKLMFLKERCHEDFAVLDQFGAKIITLKPGFNHKQNSSVKLRRRYQMNFIRED